MRKVVIRKLRLPWYLKALVYSENDDGSTAVQPVWSPPVELLRRWLRRVL